MYSDMCRDREGKPERSQVNLFHLQSIWSKEGRIWMFNRITQKTKVVWIIYGAGCLFVVWFQFLTTCLFRSTVGPFLIKFKNCSTINEKPIH